MQYDPIKRSLGKVFNKTPFLRILFYKMLDLLLLRAWHIRKALKGWAASAPKNASILDAGSGFGQYDYYMSQLGKNWNIKGVDVKQEQIDDCNDFFTKAKLNDRSTLLSGALCSLPISKDLSVNCIGVSQCVSTATISF